MKTYFSCPSCKFKISPEMKAAIKEGKCPSCGKEIEVKDIESVFLLLQTCEELKLPLSSADLQRFITVFLKDKLGCSFPDITIEESLQDKMAIAAQKREYTPKKKPAPQPPVEEYDEEDIEDDVVYPSAEDEEAYAPTAPSRPVAPKKKGPKVLPPDPSKLTRGKEDKGITFLGNDEVQRGVNISGSRTTADDINAAAEAEAKRPSPKKNKNVV